MTHFIGPLPAANYTVGREGHTMQFGGPGDPSYIVIHTMVGTVGSASARFENPASQVSAHYGVGLDGGVVQWVAEADTAYHAGNWDMNLNSIGIEHEDGGNYDGPRTDALYAASGNLVRDICLRYGIPISRQWIIKHRDVQGVATRCPDALDVDRIVTMAAAVRATTPPAAAASPPEPAIASAPAAPPAPAISSAPAAPPAPAIPPAPSAPPMHETTPAAPATEPSSTQRVISAPAPEATPGQQSGAPQQPGQPQHPQDPLRAIASAIYGDPNRWREIHSAISSVIADIPGLHPSGQPAPTSPAAAAPAEPASLPAPPSPPASAAAPVTQSPPPASPRAWGGSQGAIFSLQIIYLTILAGLAIIYFADRSLINLPETLGPISIAVPWFGALGAVLISLVGITQHRQDWDPSYRFWHWARPLLGASFGSISVLIFQAGILAVGSTPTANPENIPRNLLYYLVAFVVGYREETFRELIKRLTDIVFSPGQSTTSLSISSMTPQSGPAAGGTAVTVLGNGLSNTDSVRFGAAAAQFRVDGDGQLTVTSPAGQAGTTVTVTVTAQSAAALAGTFSYVAAS